MSEIPDTNIDLSAAASALRQAGWTVLPPDRLSLPCALESESYLAVCPRCGATEEPGGGTCAAEAETSKSLIRDRERLGEIRWNLETEKYEDVQ